MGSLEAKPFTFGIELGSDQNTHSRPQRHDGRGTKRSVATERPIVGLEQNTMVQPLEDPIRARG